MYIVTSDWHLTTKNPRIRTDNYPETQLEKVAWICNLANYHKSCVIIAGDVFDRPSYLSYPLMNKLISILKLVKKGVFVIFGQHDIHYHNPNVVKTPLGLLLASGAVKWARYCSSDIFECNYGEDYSKGNAKILVIHYPITKEEPPFFMKEAKSAKQFLKEVDWVDIVFSGDFHEHHVTSVGNRLLVNPGPISRAAKDKMNFVPKVVLVDQDADYEVFDIPVEKNVFNLDVVDKDNVVSYKEDIRELAGTIRASTVGKKYHEVLDKVVQTTEPRAAVKTIISQVMEKVYERTKAA